MGYGTKKNFQEMYLLSMSSSNSIEVGKKVKNESLTPKPTSHRPSQECFHRNAMQQRHYGGYRRNILVSKKSYQNDDRRTEKAAQPGSFVYLYESLPKRNRIRPLVNIFVEIWFSIFSPIVFHLTSFHREKEKREKSCCRVVLFITTCESSLAEEKVANNEILEEASGVFQEFNLLKNYVLSLFISSLLPDFFRVVSENQIWPLR
ncbi:hypothetical protein ACFE04_000002 [Oxalis oulophora]